MLPRTPLRASGLLPLRLGGSERFGAPEPRARCVRVVLRGGLLARATVLTLLCELAEFLGRRRRIAPATPFVDRFWARRIAIIRVTGNVALFEVLDHHACDTAPKLHPLKVVRAIVNTCPESTHPDIVGEPVELLAIVREEPRK